jgi:hypothetical protein
VSAFEKARTKTEFTNKNFVRLAPSILAADFTRLGGQVAAAGRYGADRIHVDVDKTKTTNQHEASPKTDSLGGSKC